MKKKSVSRAVPGWTLGRKDFASISAIEGVRMTSSMEADFRDFDKRALPSKKRRQILADKYGKAV